MPIYYFNIIAKKQKNKRGLFLLVSFIWIGLLSSCNAFIEKDITENAPVMIIPTANDTLYSNKVHFKWVELDGASFYNLQIVRPSFADINTFVLDSNITGEEFYQILEPGNYQFKIRGENSAHKSAYAGPFSIYVDSVSNLAIQFVSLVAPANEIYINGADDLLVSWQNLFAADYYDYLLAYGDDFTTGSVLNQEFNIHTLSYSIDPSYFDVEGKYFWGIRAVNLTSNTAYSYRQINVDLTAPNSPALISPANAVVSPIADAVTLKWSLGVDPGTVHAPVTSIVEISTTETFIDFEIFSSITTDSLVHSFPSVGDYWWRVKLVDEVGNQSEFYSSERKIIIE